MDERVLRKTLSDLPLGELRYFAQTGSTNDVALAWAAEGAPDLALVYAEEQTAGRGRAGRKWFTPAGAALAFSLVIRPLPGERQSVSLFSGLGALAVSETLGSAGLHAEIKWPNDVLLTGCKVSGILAEAVWMGEQIDSIVLGIGMNITPEAVPPAELLNFPATCLEAELGAFGEDTPTLDRAILLREILQALLYWRGLITKDVFIHAWQDRLAFRGQAVEIWNAGGVSYSGRIEGLEPDGSLRLRGEQEQAITVQFGEVQLRPVV
jgi:BirA family biotin operon repressor/biotin-[acetyl-CoA-carboxylase] ligase